MLQGAEGILLQRLESTLLQFFPTSRLLLHANHSSDSEPGCSC
ncbi:Unknown protein sequence [Pseudomonas savastanoi pv. glycinea]|uniref:Uncharacterized protein n=1 Tax=Pseudomonas savastanoi pv. glycinea TaxID=318 RepID=A0ABR5LE91_PSESG|nr:Unknown protein sequence [Pseudomonas amygdali pv. sesami]KPC26603.1 Unknown protein sequence [Pseudomonas savastanoi pv. glycinea]KPC35159.1 Unknown protein sequence [Pseudomonas savastanoi pv. glycinea]KPC45376.1 Unknown protein sequence [Pseudomonas savastanoi pv. glycinea]